MMTFQEIAANEAIRTYISRADESLIALGYTEHSFSHVTHVSATVKYILETLGFDAHTVEIGQIAGYLHDIGNLVNRSYFTAQVLQHVVNGHLAFAVLRLQWFTIFIKNTKKMTTIK